MILAPDEVAVVQRSEPDEQQAMRSNWLKRRLDTEAAFQLGLTEERIRSAEEVKLEAVKPKTAPLTKMDGHLYVDVSVNDRPSQRFLLDTGAPSIMLTRKTAESLGVDLGQKWPTGVANVAGLKIPCLYVRLDKVEVEGFWARDVEALVYRVEGEDWIFQRDILGMSFLEHFHFEINVKKSTLTLSWGEAS
jgi:clan AA aspartic protease (TIGR02281 family)